MTYYFNLFHNNRPSSEKKFTETSFIRSLMTILHFDLDRYLKNQDCWSEPIQNIREPHDQISRKCLKRCIKGTLKIL